jgi:hypothetical protein
MTETTVPTTTPKPGARRWLTPALAVVAALAIGIFGGILIGHSNASATTNTSQAGGFPGGGTGTGAEGAGTGRAGGGFTSGTITSIDGDTVTLKTTDGSTVKVTTSGTTTVTKSDTATVSDLAKGETVTVVGTTDSSGNVTATTVTEGTTGFGGGRPTE